MRKTVGLLVLVLLFAAQSGFAAENGWYAGLGVGQSSIDTGIKATSGTASVDEEDLGYKVFAGYEFNKFIAVEGFYFDAGEATITANSGDVVADGNTSLVIPVDDFKASIEGQSFGLIGVIGYPVHQYFYPYAKLGFHKWDTEIAVSAPGVVVSVEDDGTDMVFGVGFRMDVTDSVSVRGEFERYDYDGEDVDFLSAGLMYRF